MQILLMNVVKKEAKTPSVLKTDFLVPLVVMSINFVSSARGVLLEVFFLKPTIQKLNQIIFVPKPILFVLTTTCLAAGLRLRNSRRMPKVVTKERTKLAS